MKRIKLSAVFLCVLALAAASLSAEGIEQSLGLELQGAYDFPNLAGYGQAADSFVPIEYRTYANDALGKRSLGSSWGGAEAKAIIDQQWVIPALVGTSGLTKGNNLAVDLSGELSPVSLNAGVEATLTPIAFLKFSLGGKVGTGWDLAGIKGLAYYDAASDSYATTSFEGLVCQAWASGTFQFDLAALMPGDWNHVVVLASPELYYQYCTLQQGGKAWQWEADDGTNLNGWKLKGSYVLAYQMPLALNMVGVLVEPESYLFDVAELSPWGQGTGWGSDATIMGISAIFNFKLSDKSSLAVLPQVKRKIKWSDATIFDNDLNARKMEGYYWYFNRVAFDFNLKL